MQQLHDALRWMKKVPLLAWLAIALVAVVLVARRYAALATLNAAHADAMRGELAARRKAEAVNNAATAAELSAKATATAEHKVAIERLYQVRTSIDNESEAKLAERINRYFAGGGQ